METNVLVVGVGGQGILTIAQAISQTAMDLGFHVRQSEVHGMSQRGGSVQAHLRFADHELHSDLIPFGHADLLIAVEPLEAMRYAEYCCEKTTIVASSVPFRNISDYPPIDEVLDRVARLGTHVLADARTLATHAGSARAENMIMLGAASLFLELPLEGLCKWIRSSFESKGAKVVDVNVRALQFGRQAALLFLDRLNRGHTSRQIREWLSTITPEQLVGMSDRLGDASFDAAPVRTNPAIVESIRNILTEARREHREQLFEHEVYRIVEAAGGIIPPVHKFVPIGQALTADDLAEFPGDRVVLKIVSTGIVHKSDSGGVAFVTKSFEAVAREMERLIRSQRAHSPNIAGVLIVEFIDHAAHRLGSELFVGIRQSRDFGPVIAAGFGGVDTEYLAVKMRPGIAVAKAAVLRTTSEEFFAEFQKTAAYEILSGQVRGHESAVTDGELIRCFAAFIEIARQFGTAGSDEFVIQELEVNPFAFRRRRLVPLDGRGCLGTPVAEPSKRSPELIRRMLEPRSIAVAGVSAKRANLGRVILNNIQDSGFPKDRLFVIKEEDEEIDGVRCVPDLQNLPEAVDLLVAATPADSVLGLVEQAMPDNGEPPCRSIVLISGGLGEKEGTQGIQKTLQRVIQSSRARNSDTPVVLGGNCLGVRSRRGHYDTFFIPPEKLDPRRGVPAKRSALISQSGAFLITRMSNLQFLDPTFAISVGNQVDLTVSDMLSAVAEREDIDCIGVYVEGFCDLDGLAFLRAIERAVAAEKVVVFYKAGRTAAGRSAAQGHTASLAGDYDVCLATAAAAGAIVTETFKEFEQLMELATDLHHKRVGGKRIGAISNAGYESVGMADAISGVRYNLEMPALSTVSHAKMADALASHGIGHLVDAKNPLDLTPMASDAAYEACIRVMLDAEEIDAVVVGCVPMTPALHSTPAELGRSDSLAKKIPRLFAEAGKPLVCVIDCAEPYDLLARTIRAAGVPMFRSADQAIRSVGRYLSHRNERRLRSASNANECDRDAHSCRDAQGSALVGT